jgi:hypothetical protein
MRRRTILGGLATFSASLAMPAIVARAQSTAGHPRIGYLTTNFQQGVAKYISRFQRGLQELGYVESRSVEFESRDAAGHSNAETAQFHAQFDDRNAKPREKRQAARKATCSTRVDGGTVSPSPMAQNGTRKRADRD